jgi:hypothetical protein
MFLVSYVRGSAGELADLCGMTAEQYPNTLLWRAAHVNTLAMAGRHDEAHQVLDLTGLRSPSIVPVDSFRLSCLANLAETAVLLGDAELGADVARECEGYPDHLVAHYVLGMRGRVEFIRGVCDVATGRFDRAIERLERSLAHYRAEGAPCLAVVHAQFLVRALRGRGDDRGASRLAGAAALEAEQYGLSATAEQLRALAPA